MRQWLIAGDQWIAEPNAAGDSGPPSAPRSEAPELIEA